MNKSMKMTAALVPLVMAGSLVAAGCIVKRERVVETRPATVVRHDVVVERPAMPAPRVEVRTIAPGPTYHWVDGHYEWNGGAWQWAPGYWAP